MDESLNGHPSEHIECPDPLWPVDLVSGQRQQVNSEVIDTDRYLAETLDRIRVERDPMLPREACDISHRTNRPDFVVRVHDRNQPRTPADRRPDILNLYPAVLIHREIRDRASDFFKKLTGFEDG